MAIHCRHKREQGDIGFVSRFLGSVGEIGTNQIMTQSKHIITNWGETWCPALTHDLIWGQRTPEDVSFELRPEG